jgi:hypothetical protein
MFRIRVGMMGVGTRPVMRTVHEGTSLDKTATTRQGTSHGLIRRFMESRDSTVLVGPCEQVPPFFGHLW